LNVVSSIDQIKQSRHLQTQCPPEYIVTIARGAPWNFKLDDSTFIDRFIPGVGNRATKWSGRQIFVVAAVAAAAFVSTMAYWV
jgi:hypothetical protein